MKQTDERRTASLDAEFRTPPMGRSRRNILRVLAGLLLAGGVQSTSLAQTKTPTLVFSNQTTRTVKVYWIDFKNKERLYHTLAPGKSARQQTGYKHRWVMRDAGSGRALRYVIATKNDTITVRSRSTIVSNRKKTTFRQINEDGQIGSNFSTGRSPASWVKSATKGWMGALPDSTSLAGISIPGTHDSGSLYGGLAVATQSWSIKDQLEAGIRFFDIRCRPTGNAFAIHHGPFYQKQMFGDVMNAMVAFLRSNPTETVIIRWKTNEHTAQKGSKSAKDISNAYIARYRSYFYKGDGKVPTLGKVRGKVVILRNGDIDSSYGLGWNSSSMALQDYYKVYFFAHKQKKNSDWATLPSKKDLVKQYLDLPRRSSKWVFNHLSGALGMAPKDVARATNGTAYDHIGIYRYRKNVGTVIMDFPGEKLVYRIIKTNFRLKPDGYVEVFCQAGYASKFIVSYKVSGKTHRHEVKLTLGRRKRYVIPGNATAISVTGQYLFGKYKNIFTKTYSSPPNKTLKVYGTIFKRKWTEQ